MKIDKDKLDRAAYCLPNAFLWEDSPQGLDYWWNVKMALYDFGAKDYDQELKINRGQVHTDLVREAADCITDAFVWSKSFQGQTYWEDVIRNLAAMLKQRSPNNAGNSAGTSEKEREDLADAFDRAMRGI